MRFSGLTPSEGVLQSVANDVTLMFQESLWVLQRKVDSSLSRFGKHEIKSMGMGVFWEVSRPRGVHCGSPTRILTRSGEGQHWTSPGHAYCAVTERKGYHGVFPGRRQYSALRKQHLVLNYGKSLNQVEVELKQHFQTSFIPGTSYAEVF